MKPLPDWYIPGSQPKQPSPKDKSPPERRTTRKGLSERPSGSQMSMSPERPSGSQKGKPPERRTTRTNHENRTGRSSSARKNRANRAEHTLYPRSQSVPAPDRSRKKLYADMDTIYAFIINSTLKASLKTNLSELQPSAEAFAAATPYLNFQSKIEAGVFNNMKGNIPRKIQELDRIILPGLRLEIENAIGQPILQRKLASIYENETNHLNNLQAIIREIDTKTNTMIEEDTILSSAQLGAIPGVSQVRDTRTHDKNAIRRRIKLLREIALVYEAQIELTRGAPNAKLTTSDMSKVVGPAPTVNEIVSSAIQQPLTQIPVRVEPLREITQLAILCSSVIKRLREIALSNLTKPNKDILSEITNRHPEKLRQLFLQMVQLLPNDKICDRFQFMFIEMVDMVETIGTDSPNLETSVIALIDSENQILLQQFYNEILEYQRTGTYGSVGAVPGSLNAVEIDDELLMKLEQLKTRYDIIGFFNKIAITVNSLIFYDARLSSELRYPRTMQYILNIGGFHLICFELADIYKLLAIFEPLRSELTLHEQGGIDKFNKLYPRPTERIIRQINEFFDNAKEQVIAWMSPK
jgi:hypothetical protein